jgi:hypothetical protein
MIFEPLANLWPSWLHTIFLGTLVGVITFVGVSWLSPPQRPEYLERFFPKKSTQRYVKRYKFDKPYLEVRKNKKVLALLRKHKEVGYYWRIARYWGQIEEVERELKEQGINYKYFQPYQRHETWKVIFPERVKSLYKIGVKLAKEGDKLRPVRKVALALGIPIMCLGMVGWTFTYWNFPYFTWMLPLYLIGLGLTFVGMSIIFEEYKWARKLVDAFS